MHEKSIQTLEYPKILAKVANEASFSASKDLVLALEPTPDLDEARRRLAYTSEASHLIDLNAEIGVRGAHDIRSLLLRAARDGILAPTEMVDILTTLRSTQFVARALDRLEAERFPLLRALGDAIPLRPHIIRRIGERVRPCLTGVSGDHA
jgi:DNA mismatch repair protein MutS2